MTVQTRRTAAALLGAVGLAGCLGAPPAGSGGQGDGGGGGESDGGGGGPCGTASALRDEFDDSALDERRWGTMGEVTQTGGAARISSPAGNFAGLISDARYQVGGSVLVADLGLDLVADARLAMTLNSDLGYRVGINLQSGMLWLDLVDDDGTRRVGTRSFDLARHHWRLREEGGQFYFATSSDGASWDDEDGPYASDLGELAQVAFEVDPLADDSVVAVHSVNADQAGAYCPAASFIDDFTAPSPRWQIDEQGDCSVAISDSLFLGYSDQALCALTAFERFDLRDSAFAVELIEVYDCAPQPIMVVTLAGGQELSILCRDDGGVRKLVAAEYTGVGELSTVNYDPALHRFVQLRHDPEAGNLVFEALGNDESAWVPFGDWVADPDDLAAVSLRFYLGGPTSGGYESVVLDSLNVTH